MVTYDRHRERIINTSSSLEGYEYITYSKREIMYDCLIENFHSRSAKGEIFNNPMLIDSVVEEKPFWGSRVIGHSQYNNTPIDRSYWSPVYAAFLPTPSETYADLGTVRDLALTRAHAGVGADQIDLLTSIAELNESVKTIVNVGVKTAKVMRKLRKFNLKAIAKGFNLRDVREQYLEFRYGLRPMYYDLKGVHDYLKSEISYDRHTSRGYSAYTAEVSNDIITEIAYLWPWSTRPTVSINFARRTYVKSSSRAGVLFAAQFTDNLSKVIAELGVDRPISSVWELVPFSFMIDWFANIGDTIRAWEPKPHCSSLASWSVDCVEQISEVKPISIVFLDIGYSAIVYSSTLTFPQTAVKRIVSRSRTPSPRLAILPSIDINLSTPKLLDMAAIFSGLAESKRRQGW